MNLGKLIGIFLSCGVGWAGIGYGSSSPAVPGIISFNHIQVQGELGTRMARNFDRLAESYYQPDQDFPSMKESGDWPGDKEGRILLGLTIEAQATHVMPRYLTEILRLYPEKFNSRGYFGNICPTGMAG